MNLLKKKADFPSVFVLLIDSPIWFVEATHSKD